MSGYDAQFLYDERPDEPQHTLKLALLCPSASRAWALEATRRRVSERLPALHPLCWRAIRVPSDLHHAVWVADAQPDLRHHVRRLAVPAPGGRPELCDAVSRLAGRPLDPNRPLWELWLLEGLEGGRTAVLLKLSHALADGGCSRALLEGLLAEAPLEPPREAPLLESVPSKIALLRAAACDLFRDLFVEAPRLLRATLVARRRSRAERRARPRKPGLSLLAQPPLFGGRLGRRRAFQFASVPLEQAREVRAAFDCSINDVVIATAAGAVRRYLLARRELPGVAGRGFLPASIRDQADARNWGNRIAVRPIQLPTHLADPTARLLAVREETSRAKADLRLLEGAHLEEWGSVLPPFVAKLVSATARAAVRLWPDRAGGVTVTSVRGPEPLRTPGGRVENVISVGHMKYAAGLNVTVWSYAENLNFGLYTCADAVPDLARLAEYVGEAFEELRKAAARELSRIA